jgi:hypothetical protein
MTLATQYYLSPNGSNSNDGLTPATAFQTPLHVQTEIFPQIRDADPNFGGGAGVTISILGDYNGAITMIPGWAEQGSVFATIDGSQAVTTGATGVIASATHADPSVPTEWRIDVPGFDFAPHVGQWAQITAGPNSGNGWGVLADLGSGNAIISAPHLALSYDAAFQSAYAVSALDPFAFKTFPKFGDELILAGTGGFGLQMCRAGTGDHGVQSDLSAAFFDTCVLSNWDQYVGGSQWAMCGCIIQGAIRAYDQAIVLVARGGSLSSPIVDRGGHIAYMNHTIVGGKLRTGAGKGTYSLAKGWLAISNVTTAVDLGPGSEVLADLESGYDVRMFGTNVAPPRIRRAPGARIFYDRAKPPNFVGAAGVDVESSSTNVVILGD